MCSQGVCGLVGELAKLLQKLVKGKALLVITVQLDAFPDLFQGAVVVTALLIPKKQPSERE